VSCRVGAGGSRLHRRRQPPLSLLSPTSTRIDSHPIDESLHQERCEEPTDHGAAILLSRLPPRHDHIIGEAKESQARSITFGPYALSAGRRGRWPRTGSSRLRIAPRDFISSYARVEVHANIRFQSRHRGDQGDESTHTPTDMFLSLGKARWIHRRHRRLTARTMNCK